MKNLFDEKKRNNKSVVAALLILIIFSFGIMLPWLGYGFDEWHFIYYSTRGIQGLTKLFHYDGHPQAVWSYISSFNIFGYTPYVWHLYSLVLRFLSVITFWLCLKEIWPNNSRQNFLAAALFAIHPIFTLQIFPISYFEIWLGYIMLFLSFYFNILAIKRSDRQKEFFSISFLLALGHVFTREYAWFVELMRPIFIWFLLIDESNLQNKIIRLLKVWAPFFIIFLSSMVWRGFFYTPLRQSFQIDKGLFENPFTIILGWVINLIPDIGIVLISSWFNIFNPKYVYLIRPLNIILLLLVIFLTVYGRKYVQQLDAHSQSDKNWFFQALLLGLPSLLLGILPFYFATYSLHLTETPHNSRLAIGMLPGAALTSTVIIEKLISKSTIRTWFIALLLSLMVAWHIRYTNDYRKAWEYQSNLLEQLTWRVPGIEKDTALFVLQDSLPEMDIPDAQIVYADFSLSMALNSIYQVDPIPDNDRLSYWFYTYSDSMDLSPNITLHSGHATTFFDGNTTDSLFFYYDSSNNRCLHLIVDTDMNYKQYPEHIKKLAESSSADSVLPVITQNVKLKEQVFSVNSQNWCFYYQKADLARQFGNWEEISALWQDIIENNLHTSFGMEYLPFVEGLAHSGDWETAQMVTLKANRISKAMDSALCPLWANLRETTPSSPERDLIIQQVYDKLKCNTP